MSGDARRAVISQRVEIFADRDERRDALDQRWAALLESLGLIALPMPNSLADPAAWLAAADPALIVLTGGNDLAHLVAGPDAAPERDRTEALMLQRASAEATPLLAVCRGLQLIVDSGGGALVPVEGHVAQDHAITTHTAAANWPIRDGRSVNSFHNWGVEQSAVPVGWELAATAADGTVEAIVHSTLPQVALMWHPERGEADADDIALIEQLIGQS
ncbi:MAG: gamma-glutamyl-gamma-aminobutyrate hydrolase family protein [Solirubrobacteraceae bacterium]|nr:gamma-glutamyl-gamma-aminobutyrate hydrolase family protein [Solirubrobacteraceae bacterium]